MDALALLSLEPPLATLTLNRSGRHNSLVPELLEDLLAALETVRARSDLHVLVLLARGRSFSTGGDLKGFADHAGAGEPDHNLGEYADRLVGLLNRLILAMVDLPIPIVAAVQGMVTGGSIGLVLASDVVLVSENASFTPYYGIVGFSPDGGWTALLPEFIGLRRTSEILLANQTITPGQAVAWGLANHLVSAETIQEEARGIARKIASHQPGSLRAAKQNLRARLGDIEARLDMERERFVQTILMPQTRRSMMAFLDSLN